MRSTLHWLLMLTAAATAGCSSDSEPNDDGNGGGNGAAGAVTVGNIFFRSGHNSTQNPAIDTVAAGATVTWTWSGTGDIPHSVRSEEAPTFTSSQNLTGNGQTYAVTLTTPGTYHYDCAVHGDAMTGTIVVQ